MSRGILWINLSLRATALEKETKKKQKHQQQSEIRT
jgi:hypothetical protein